MNEISGQIWTNLMQHHALRQDGRLGPVHAFCVIDAGPRRSICARQVSSLDAASAGNFKETHCEVILGEMSSVSQKPQLVDLTGRVCRHWLQHAPNVGVKPVHIDECRVQQVHHGRGALIRTQPAGEQSVCPAEGIGPQEPIGDTFGQKPTLALQTALNERGLASGTPDGLMGPGTRGALRRYQRNLGLAADGYPTLDLLWRLQQR